MATPNMSKITASLEKSLKNCSLSTHQHINGGTTTPGSSSSSAVPAPNSPEIQVTDSTVELSSEALPFHWEQCLDLKTGEIYYINWRTGMRTSEDPRLTYISDEEESIYYDDDDDNDDSESSSDSSASSSREQWSKERDQAVGDVTANSPVLVVAGCKGCFMYYMVPKQNEVCPKCCGQLIHFDRSENGSG